jgi:hypothetical protein
MINSCKEEASAKADKYFSILFRSISSGFCVASSSFFRGEYSKFLKEAAVLVKDPNLDKCANIFTDCAAKYRELRKLLLSIQYGKHDIYEIALVFINNFKEVMRYEEEALANLRISVI